MQIRHLFGEVTAAGDDLTFKNVHGNYRDADIFFGGKILKYTNDDPTYVVSCKSIA